MRTCKACRQPLPVRNFPPGTMVESSKWDRYRRGPVVSEAVKRAYGASHLVQPIVFVDIATGKLCAREPDDVAILHGFFRIMERVR